MENGILGEILGSVLGGGRTAQPGSQGSGQGGYRAVVAYYPWCGSFGGGGYLRLVHAVTLAKTFHLRLEALYLLLDGTSLGEIMFMPVDFFHQTLFINARVTE